jgi:TPR repeat protein
VEKFKEGIAKGDAGSMYYYAGSLSEGWGVPRKDPKEAVSYYQKAAEKYRETASNNDLDSIFYYASSLENIDDIEKLDTHREEIRSWYKRAAEAGHAKAAEWCKTHQVQFTPPN